MADESIPRVLCRHPCLHVLDSSVSRSCISRRQCGTPHRRQRLGRRAGAHGPVALPVRRPRKDLHDHVGLDDHGRPERSGGDPSLSSARRNCRSRSRVGLISSRTGQQSVIWVFLTVADTREVILMNAAAAVVETSLDAATETRLGRLRWWNVGVGPVSYTHLRAHETKANLVCRLLLENKKKAKPAMPFSQLNHECEHIDKKPYL